MRQWIAFGILKSECFHGTDFKSIDELEQRPSKNQVKLKRLSPIDI